MEKILLNVFGITYSKSQTGAYVLILEEVNGKRRLPIVIGSFEAQAIAIEIEKIKPSRPLTHDLFKSFADEFNIKIIEVVINKFHEGIFYSKLVCENKEKIISEIDSRTSDAVALALRFRCPIYTYPEVLNEAGILFEDLTEGELEEEEEEEDNEFARYSDEELKEMLSLAIDEEDYEKASKIRDELKKREAKK